MGIKEADLPTILIFKSQNKFKYKYPHKLEDLTADTIGAFIQDVNDGKIERYVLTEKPVDNTGKALHILVGTNYNETISDPTRDVFVLHYQSEMQEEEEQEQFKSVFYTWNLLAE